jgi:hypothetical protein
MYWQSFSSSLAPGQRGFFMQELHGTPMNNIQPQSAEAQKANRYFRKEEQKKAEAVVWAEHHASQAAVLEKTARLKALRLARDAALRKRRFGLIGFQLDARQFL